MALSKAFDSVPHGLLIAKCKAYGLSLDSCKLLASYLHNRYQRVKLLTSRSEWLPVSRGFPQGSILGPLFFNIYFNDVFYLNIDANIYNYADDNIISVSNTDVDTIQSILCRDAQVLNTWFMNNSMQANPAKFQCSLVCSNHNRKDDVALRLVIDGTDIQSVSCMKVLGVNVDNALTFGEHISVIASKAGRQVNALRRLNGVLDIYSKEAILKSFIKANFNYCPIVWMFANRGDIDKLEKILERAIRFVYNDYTTSTPCLFADNNCLSIRQSNINYLASEVFKCVNGLNPAYMGDMFECKITGYSLRRKKILVQPPIKSTTYGLRSVRYFGAKLWNMLEPEMTETENFQDFKNLLSSWKGPNCVCPLCTFLT